MTAHSAIQWTDHTFNPWIGCTHVSPGCENCYAEVNTFTRAQRAKGRELWGATAPRHMISEAKWAEVVRWNRDAAAAGRGAKVFCASLADVFERHVAVTAARQRLWALIEATPALTWQLLTKRPENVGGMVPIAWLKRWPANVWLGASVEDRARLSAASRGPSSVASLGMRPRGLNLAWIRRGVEQCRVHGTAPFVKQFGARPTASRRW